MRHDHLQHALQIARRRLATADAALERVLRNPLFWGLLLLAGYVIYAFISEGQIHDLW